MVTIQIPFDGFYESISGDNLYDTMLGYSYEGDEEIEFIEPTEEQRKKATIDYCEIYLESLNEWVLDNIGLSLGLQFDSLVSPKFYNFQTDRLFAKISKDVVKSLYNEVSLHFLGLEIKECFTPRDGFIPFYSNDVKDWINKDVNSLDEIELGVLLSALLREYNFNVNDFATSLCDNSTISDYYFSL